MTAGTLIPARKAPVSPAAASMLPGRVADAGQNARRRFFEFFTVRIPNANTREAYHRDCLAFFLWCERRGLRDLAAIQPPHVAAFLADFEQTHATTTVRRALAAIRSRRWTPRAGQFFG